MGNYLRAFFYVYIYFRPDWTPCYVGKGCRKRWLRHEKETANPYLRHIIRKAGGSLPKMKVQENMTEEHAFALEMLLIKIIGREEFGGPLVNLTDGGEGASGLSAEARAKIVAKQKGKPKSPSHCAAMRVPKGPMSEKNKAAIIAGQRASPNILIGREIMRQKLTGKPKTDAHRIAAGLARRGIKPDKESRRKMSIAAKRRGLHPNFVAGGLAALRGHSVSQETRNKIRDAQKGVPKSAEAVRAATVARNLTFLAKRFSKQLGLSWPLDEVA